MLANLHKRSYWYRFNDPAHSSPLQYEGQQPKIRMLLACLRTAVSLVIAATMRDRPILSIGISSERLMPSIRRTRNLWIIASISAAQVITTYD